MGTANQLSRIAQGQPYTIVAGYKLSDCLGMFAAGLVAGFAIALGVLAYLGVERWCR